METAGHIEHCNRHWLCYTVPAAHGAGDLDGVSVPKGEAETKREKELIWYGNYLLALQREYLELIEFCFDENFYSGALGNLHDRSYTGLL